MNLGGIELNAMVGTIQIGAGYLGDICVFRLESSDTPSDSGDDTPSSGGDTPSGGDTGDGGNTSGGDSGSTGGDTPSGGETGGDTPSGGETGGSSSYTKFKMEITNTGDWGSTELGLIVNGNNVYNTDSSTTFTAVQSESGNFNFWGANHNIGPLFDGSTSEGLNGSQQSQSSGAVVFTSATAIDASSISGVCSYHSPSWASNPSITLYGWNGSDWDTIGTTSGSSSGSGWTALTF